MTTRRPAASTPAAIGPFNDQLTDEQQTVRVTGRDRRHVHADLQRPDDGAAAVRRHRAPRSTRRSRRSRTSAPTRSRPPAARSTGTANVERVLPARAAAGRPDRRSPADGAGLTGAHARDHHRSGGRLAPAPVGRLAPRRAEHQRPARQDPAHQGQGRPSPRPTPTRPTSAPAGRVHDPGREPVPARRRRAAGQDPRRGLRDGLPQPVPDPGRRERRRVRDRLLAGLATRTRAGAARPAPGATRSSASRPTTAGRCATRRKLGYYKWSFHEWAPDAAHPGAERQQQGMPPPPRRS